MANIPFLNNAYFAAKVGIGTISPTTKLYVHNGEATIASTTDGVKLSYSNGNSSGIIDTAFSDNNLEFRTNGTAKMWIANGGNVGIGTTSPASLLHIQGSTYHRIETFFDGSYTSGWKFSDLNGGIKYDAGSDNLVVFSNFTGTGAKMTFETQGSEKMRITSAGNVGIGTTSPGDKLEIGNLTNYTGLTVKGAGASRPAVTFKNVSQSLLGAIYGTENRGMIIETGGNGTNGTVALTLSSAGALKLNTYTAGTLVSDASGNITVSSGGGAGGPYLPLAGGTLTGDLIIQKTENVYLTLESTNTSTTKEVAVKYNNYSTGSNYWWSGLNQSANYSLAYGTSYSGANVKMEISTAGNATFAGNITISNASPALNLTDTDNASNIAFSSVGGALIVNSSSDQVYQIAGSEKMRITSAGNVGIKTTSPANPLGINFAPNGISSITTSNNSTAWNTSSAIMLEGASNSNGLGFGVSGTANDRKSWIQSGHPDQQYASNLGTLAINPLGGNVGIGTTSPDKKLHVTTNTSNSTPQVLVQNSGTGDASMLLNVSGQSYVFGIDYDDSKKFKIASSGNLGTTDRITLLSTGNVGIGTISPTQLLHVNSTTANPTGIGLQNSQRYYSVRSNNFSLVFTDETVGSERMRITSTGNVGIGTTSPTAKLHVAGTGLFTGLVSGITPVAAANFVTKAYVDGSGGGTGPFLPLAGGTLSGTLNITQTTSDFIDLTRDLATDQTWRQAISGAGSFSLYDVTRGADVFTLDTSGDATFAGDVTATANYSAGNSKIIYKAQRSGGAVAGDWSYDDATTDMSLGTSTAHSFSLKTGNTRALTINSSQNATFAGGVVSNAIVQANGFRTTTGSTDYSLLTRNSSNTAVYIQQAGSGNILDVRYGSQAAGQGTSAFAVNSSGNVGIGTTSPRGKLDIVGNTDNDSDFLTIQDDDASAGSHRPSIRFRSNTAQIGQIVGLNGSMRFSSGTTENSMLEILDNGNVGIGTTSPDNRLDVVASDVNITPNAESSAVFRRNGNNYLTILSNASNEGGILFGNAVDDNDGSVSYKHNTQSMQFATADVERMRITSTGNVGIGDASPTSISANTFSLSVNSSRSDLSGALISKANGTVKHQQYWDSSGYSFNLSANSGNFQFNGGNVGIGTTSPGALLEISGIRENQIRLTSYDTTAAVDETIGGIEFYSSDAGNEGVKASISAIAANTEGSAYMTFSTGTNTEKMRIDSAGNVGIGTTSPLQLLHVNGASDGNSIYTAMLQNTGTAPNTASKLLFVQGGSTIRGAVIGGLQEATAGSPTSMVFETSAAYATPTERMRIDSSGNVGIGVTPRTISNYKILDISGSGGAGGYIGLSSDSTQQGEIYSHGGGVDIVAIGAKQMRFFTNGSQQAVITSSGNVGIGTTSPSEKLQLKGDSTYISVIAGDGSNGAKLGTDSSGDGLLQLYSDAGVNNIKLYGEAASPSYINAGNLGIGTTAPTRTLDVRTDSGVLIKGATGTANAKISFLPASGGRQYDLGNVGADFRIFDASAGVTRMYFDNDGNTGIGTTTPGYKLDVVSTGDGLLSLTGGTKPAMIFKVGTAVVGGIQAQANTSLNVSAYGTSSLNLQTAGTTPRLTILTGGNVGIGETSVDARLHITALASNGISNVKLESPGTSKWAFGIPAGQTYFALDDVNDNLTTPKLVVLKTSGNVGIGTITPDSLLEIEGATNSSTSNLLRLSRATQGSTPEKVAGFYSGTSGEKGYITVNNFGTAYNTSSDYRLKENIKPIDDSVERLMSLKPCNFNFISEDEDKVVMDGFIAHEAKEVVPESVTGIKDAVDEKGNPAYQGIDQSKLVPLLTAALQKALQRIEILEQKINN